MQQARPDLKSCINTLCMYIYKLWAVPEFKMCGGSGGTYFSPPPPTKKNCERPPSPIKKDCNLKTTTHKIQFQIYWVSLSNAKFTFLTCHQLCIFVLWDIRIYFIVNLRSPQRASIFPFKCFEKSNDVNVIPLLFTLLCCFSVA